MEDKQERKKRNRAAGELPVQTPAHEATPQGPGTVTEAESIELEPGGDHIAPAGIDPASEDTDPDRIGTDDQIDIPDELVAEEPAPGSMEPDTTQRPSAEIPGRSPALRPGSGQGESRWNDPGAIKSHIYDLEHVAPKERAAAQAAEAEQARLAEEQGMHDEAEQIGQDRTPPGEISEDDRARYMGEAKPEADDERAGHDQAPADQVEPPAPPAAEPDKKPDAREIAREYRESKEREAATKSQEPDPAEPQKQRPGIDID